MRWKFWKAADRVVDTKTGESGTIIDKDRFRGKKANGWVCVASDKKSSLTGKRKKMFYLGGGLRRERKSDNPKAGLDN